MVPDEELFTAGFSPDKVDAFEKAAHKKLLVPVCKTQHKTVPVRSVELSRYESEHFK